MYKKLYYLLLFILTVSFAKSSQAQATIGEFETLAPSSQDALLYLPETHDFQYIIRRGDPISAGGTMPSKFDFTGYVPDNGSSVKGTLSINEENDDGGLTMIDLELDEQNKEWVKTYSKIVDFSGVGGSGRNCSGDVTPWGTIITSEEVDNSSDWNGDGYKDIGWNIEVDPKSKTVIGKLWAMGRFSHENVKVHSNRRTVYQGNDQNPGYLFRFVADCPGDLNNGKLYVYKGSKNGNGSWFMVPNETQSQRNEVRAYASSINATSFNGIEDVDIDNDGFVYFAVKGENRIYKFQDVDPINGTSVLNMHTYVGGNVNYTISNSNGNYSANWGYGNDNIAFDNENNMWVCQDGQLKYIWVVRPDHTQNNPKVEIFARTPNGCEPTGMTFSPDYKYMFVSIQHPNTGNGTYQQDAFGTSYRFNRDVAIVIARNENLNNQCSPCITCSDGIQNYTESGVDCGGSCEVCDTCFDGIQNGNETGIDCGPGCVDCPQLNIVKSDVDCFGEDNGFASANLNGGVGIISYTWSNGDTGSSIDNLSPGTYSVEVCDQYGNNDIQTIVINSPANALSINETIVPASGSGATDGIINLSISGGTAPYSFLWSTGATSEDLTNLSDGDYYVTVTDDNGCSITKSFHLNSPDCSLFSISSETTDVSCFDSANGSAMILIAGGTAPFTYNWSNGGNNQQENNLSAGIYSVTVEDVNGCSQTEIITINEPASSLSLTTSATDETADGADDGTAEVMASGGTAPYSYLWSNGETTALITGLNPGDYNIIVTDQNNCTELAFVTINGQSANNQCPFITATIIETDESCFGASDGSLIAIASGGADPYTYEWSNGMNMAGITGLNPGDYFLTITDDNGCKGYLTASIQQGIQLSGELVKDDRSPPAQLGEIEAFINGGTTPYTYLWSNGETTSLIDELLPDIYSVIVTDQNGCEFTDSIEIKDQICNDLLLTTVIQDIECDGDDNGIIISTTSGGNSPFTYSWNNGETSTLLTGLEAGTYTITVTDDVGCTFSSTEIIGAQASLLSLNIIGVDETGINTNDGSAIVAVSGGVGPYTYSWSNGESTQSINNLTSGTYTVTVTDANNCSESTDVTLTGSNCPAISINTVVSDVSCFGSNDGSIVSIVTGGQAPYTYSWSNGSTLAVNSNLTAGNYVLSITDSNNCTETVSETIAEPAQMLLTTSAGNVSGPGQNDGFAVVSVSGGTSPYSYNWSNGSTNSVITGLSEGTYTVIVTDATGCTQFENIEILGSSCSSLTVTAAIQDIKCNGGDNGSIVLNVTGGSSPYTYSWSNGSTSSFLNNLLAGTYAVTVTDASGCNVLAIYDLEDPQNILINNISSTDISYFGLDDGTATVEVISGSPSYSYNWSNGATTSSINNLSAGNYTVTINDVNGCTVTASATVNPLNCNLSAITSATNVSCFGDGDGSVNISVNGGVNPIHIGWNTGDNGNTINNLSPGSYDVFVIDANGCTVKDDVTINEPQPINLNINKTDITQSGLNNGTANATVSGGTPPYTYSWSNGNTSSGIANLAPGTYTLTVTDDVGCSISASAVISDIDCSTLNIGINSGDISCNGLNNGFVSASLSGGYPPYSYAWSNGSIASAIAGLASGSYSVNITDNLGCTVSGSATISEPSALNATTSSTDETAFNASDGTASVSVSGGTPPYSYNWSNGATSSFISGLSGGTYGCTVTDANNCVVNVSATVDGINCGTININPSVTNVSCNGEGDGAAIVNPSGGAAPYSFAWSNGSTSNSVSGLFPGTHIITVTDANGCSTSENITVTQPGDLNLLLTTNNESAAGENDGSASLTIAGGTAPFNIQWSNGISGTTINNLSPGSYSVTVTDANNCTETSSFTIFDGAVQCLPPTGVMVSSVQETSAVITWTQDPVAIGYTVQFRDVTAGTPWTVVTSSLNFIILSNLNVCSDYEVWIFTQCPNGGLTAPTISSFSTTGCSAPCDPLIGLFNNNITSSSVILVWDLYAGASYNLFYREQGQGWNVFNTTYPLTILFTLSSCTTYEWYIEVECEPGVFSVPSAIKTFTTLGCAQNENDDQKLEVQINEEYSFEDLNVYPVPADQFINVEYKSDQEGTTHLELFNIQGQSFGTFHFEDISGYNRNQLNISHLPSGNYFLRLKNRDKSGYILFDKL